MTPQHTAFQTGPGWFDVMVKVYPEGQVSQYIHTMDVGDILQCKGPYLGEFEYEPNQYTRYGLLAAGTGVQPPALLCGACFGDQWQPEHSQDACRLASAGGVPPWGRGRARSRKARDVGLVKGLWLPVLCCQALLRLWD